MTISYVQAFEPIWYIVDEDGTAAGGAQLFTYDSLTREPRATYEDPLGNIPNTNPIIFALNGTYGPIYWQVDTTDPQGYYIEVYDAAGVLLWFADNFPNENSGGGGGGGGGTTTEYIAIKNYITNNQFINHTASIASISSMDTVIAPSNHKGFTPADVNPLVGTFGVVGPDIRFIKSNILATDQITFGEFPLSSNQLLGDVTPVTYIEYTCTGAGAGETYKNFQFPITQKVKNLSNQSMTFTLWAKTVASPATLDIFCRQYYGSGTGATPEALAVTYIKIGQCVLSTSWTKFPIQFTVNNVSGKSIGTPGSQTNDDAIYIEIGMPLSALCDIEFTKPCLYLGTFAPSEEFDSYDEIDSINSTARTGDIKTSLLTNAPLGWLPMNDSTIGNIGSGATFAGAYTFQLYTTIYTSVSNTYAPVSGTRTSPGNTVVAAIADFLANKTLTLPLSLGRALAGAGSGAGLTTRALGQNLGSETISIAAMPTHAHDQPSASTDNWTSFTTLNGTLGEKRNYAVSSGTTALNINPQGGSAADGNMPPTSFFNVFIKL